MSSVTLNVGIGVYTIDVTSQNATTTPSAASLMTEPAAGADVGMIIAKMIIENAFTNRMQARQDRQRATNAMVDAQKNQIGHMREAAEKRFEAAQVEAWGKIVDGGCGVVGGCVTAGLGGQSNMTDEGRQNNTGRGSAISSGGDLVSAGTSLWAAGTREEGEQLDADAKAAENDAAQQKRLVEGADDDMKEAREYTRAALDFLREFESTQNKSMSSAIKG